MGARNLGIYEITPPEPLHGFKLGLCKYLYEVLSSEMAPKTMRLMNSNIKLIIQNSGHQSVRNLPCLNTFRNGIDACHSLTAKETYARLFAIYLTLMDKKIFQSFAEQQRYVRTKDSTTKKMRFVSKGPMGHQDAVKWFRLIEETLLFDSWLMKPSHSFASVQLNFNERLMDNNDLSLEHDSPAQSRIRKYLSHYKEIVKRETRNKLKLPKVHQHLHYDRQIRKDGSLLNIDGGRPESNNKPNSKNPAQLTQKSQGTITIQLARNYHDNLIVDEATRQVSRFLPHSNEQVSTSHCGSQFLLKFICLDYSELESFEVELKWKGSEVMEEVSTHLCRCITRRLFLHTSEGGCLTRDSVIKGFTEYQYGGTVYRAHPSFRKQKPWFDWAMLQWDDTAHPIPARLIMFLDLVDANIMTPGEHRAFCAQMIQHDQLAMDEEGAYTQNRTVDHEYSYLTNGKWAVVEACLVKNELPDGFDDSSIYQMSSELAQRYYLEEQYRIVPVETIVAPAYCIGIPSTRYGSILNSKEEIFSVHKKEDWAQIFLDGA